MTHQQLVLTEEAIKGHCKRLKKLLNSKDNKIFNKETLSLCEVQELFSKTLGFNNFHELKQILSPKEKDYIAKAHDQLFQFCKFIEHTSSFVWIKPNGDVFYQPHDETPSNNNTQKEFVRLNNKFFNEKEFQDLSEFLLQCCADENYQGDMAERIIKFPSLSHHLMTRIENIVDDGLLRIITPQVYFDKNKKVTSIKILINYKFIDGMYTILYKDAKKYLMTKNLSVKEKPYHFQKHYQFKMTELEKNALEAKYLTLFELCANGDLERLKEYEAVDFNKTLITRNGENYNSLHLALFFEHFHIVDYLVDNVKKFNIDLHSSNDYLLRRCCLQGSEDHFDLIKKMMNITNFKNVSKNLSISNLLEVAFNKNEEIANYLKDKIS